MSLSEDVPETLRDMLMRRLGGTQAQEWARDITGPGGFQRLGVRTATVPGSIMPPIPERDTLFQAPEGGSARAFQEGARAFARGAPVPQYVAPQVPPIPPAPVPPPRDAAIGPASEAAPTAPTTVTAERGDNAAPEGPPASWDARMATLLKDFKPTLPAHEQMRQQLLGGDPVARRGFHEALGSPDPEIQAAVKTIRELRGNQEGQSTVTTLPVAGAAGGGGRWRNPGIPGWDETNVRPVGGGQFRDFNFGGYGDPVRQQQAAAMKQHMLLQSLGPQGAAHYLTAQMAQQTRDRELDIEAAQQQAQAAFQQTHGAALTTQAQAAMKHAEAAREQGHPERVAAEIRANPSLLQSDEWRQQKGMPPRSAVERMQALPKEGTPEYTLEQAQKADLAAPIILKEPLLRPQALAKIKDLEKGVDPDAFFTRRYPPKEAITPQAKADYAFSQIADPARREFYRNLYLEHLKMTKAKPSANP